MNKFKVEVLKLCLPQMRGHLNLTNYEDGCNLLHRPCLFQNFGCNFEGPIYRLKRHEDEERQYHYYLLCESGYYIYNYMPSPMIVVHGQLTYIYHHGH